MRHASPSCQLLGGRVSDSIFKLEYRVQLPDLKPLGSRRLKILWIVLGALLLVSVTPLWLYHREVLRLSEDKLEDAERVQQQEIARAIAGEILQFQSNLHEELATQRQFMALAGWIPDVNDPSNAPPVSRLLQKIIESNPNILYVTAVNRQARGESAGSIRADQDPFVDATLKRAFTASIQQVNFVSEPFALQPNNRPALVMSVPLFSGGQFTGMLAAVVSLDRVVARLQDASTHDRVFFVVDIHGHIVAHAQTNDMIPGLDVSRTSAVVQKFKELPQDLRTTATIRFNEMQKDSKHQVEMIGTYSTIPALRWAVVAQRSMEQARIDAGVEDLTREALRFVLGATFVALLFGYLFALGITQPIQSLVSSTRAISRAEFHERVEVSGAAEISELAETFNSMANDIEQHVERLEQAARENHDLFVGSIRMLSAAIDEKDPYTRGHSGRVARYCLIIGEGLGLGPEELERLRIAALLHDVGKIGVDDRVLKKPGQLTAEEFDLMKQHTIKGANIMRPVAKLNDVLPGIELHHERMDGKGYPYGLKSDQIPLMARIIAVADTFDAMTTNRPYQSAMELDYAMERIRSYSDTKFDPTVIQALEAAVHSGRLRISATLVEV
jgi:HD-GYP domain-containing protein (c-di-GMP phosphodiesterase class II)